MLPEFHAISSACFCAVACEVAPSKVYPVHLQPFKPSDFVYHRLKVGGYPIVSCHSLQRILSFAEPRVAIYGVHVALHSWQYASSWCCCVKSVTLAWYNSLTKPY